jgi:tRNA(Ile)-lysidine synthase
VRSLAEASATTSELLAHCTFPPAGTAVTCAVSGGSDSMGLMILAIAAGCVTTVVHVDHGLRPGSAAEAAVVAAAATRFGAAAFVAETVAVAPGPNLEARARAARYAVLPPDVMTGHTADDQAETVLLNLMRGATSRGLAAMRPGPRRPLLRLRRAALAALCRDLGVTVVVDPSNSDPAYLRNRVRHDVLPLLDDVAQRDLVPVLTRQADLLREESDLLDSLALGLDPTDAKALATAPLALARRAVSRWLTGEHPPDAATVERVLRVAAGGATGCDIGGGRRVERSMQRLRLLEEPSPTPNG